MTTNVPSNGGGEWADLEELDSLVGDPLELDLSDHLLTDDRELFSLAFGMDSIAIRDNTVPAVAGRRWTTREEVYVRTGEKGRCRASIVNADPSFLDEETGTRMVRIRWESSKKYQVIEECRIIEPVIQEKRTRGKKWAGVPTAESTTRAPKQQKKVQAPKAEKKAQAPKKQKTFQAPQKNKKIQASSLVFRHPPRQRLIAHKTVLSEVDQPAKSNTRHAASPKINPAAKASITQAASRKTNSAKPNTIHAASDPAKLKTTHAASPKTDPATANITHVASRKAHPEPAKPKPKTTTHAASCKTESVAKAAAPVIIDLTNDSHSAVVPEQPKKMFTDIVFLDSDDSDDED